MTNWRKSKHFCWKRKWDELVLICVGLSAALNGFSKREVHGALCLLSSGSGTVFTDISVACNKNESLKRYSPSWQKMLSMKSWVSTPRFLKCTAMVWAQKRLTQNIGKSKGGKTTKIHVAVDKAGRPIKFLLSAGNINDISVATV